MRKVETPWGPFWVYDNDLVGKTIEAGSYWDPHLIPIFDRACRPDAVTIEVGAHIGFHTVDLAARALGVRAWEPIAWPALDRNITERGLSNVRWSNQAIYSMRGSLVLASPENQLTTGQVVSLDACESVGSLTLIPGWQRQFEAESLDRLYVGADPISLLKIDAQGSDLHVLFGAEDLIQKHRPVIVCEFEEKLAQLHGHTSADYRRWFEEHRYKTEAVGGCDILGVPQ